MSGAAWPAWYRPPQPKRVSALQIKVAVCKRFKISLEDIEGPRRHYPLSRPRQLAMRIMFDMSPLSLSQIGQQFGARDHSTVYHAIHATNARVKGNPEWRGHYDAIRRELAL